MKKINISIGISAYNEEKNIGKVLEDLKNQVLNNIKISKVLVLSDGSTDDTVRVCLQSNTKNLVVQNNKKRMGKYYRENAIFRMASDPVLVILDADISLPDKYFLEKLVSPIINGFDLVSPAVSCHKPTNFFQKSLLSGVIFQHNLFSSFNGGDNVYNCHGVARSFSKNLYKKINYKPLVGEDAYSYFFALKNGFKFKFVETIQAIFKLPSNFNDYKKQSLRFKESIRLMKLEFGDKYVTNKYQPPKLSFTFQFLKSLIKSPISFIVFVLVNKVPSQLLQKKHSISVTWDIAKSSK